MSKLARRQDEAAKHTTTNQEAEVGSGNGTEVHNPHTNGDTSCTKSDFKEASGEEWVYLDDNGAQQGPFSPDKMQQWWQYGFLRSNLLVKKVAEAEFKMLWTRGDLIENLEVLPHSTSEYKNEQEQYYDSEQYSSNPITNPTAPIEPVTSSEETTESQAENAANKVRTPEDMAAFRFYHNAYGYPIAAVTPEGSIKTAYNATLVFDGNGVPSTIPHWQMTTAPPPLPDILPPPSDVTVAPALILPEGYTSVTPALPAQPVPPLPPKITPYSTPSGLPALTYQDYSSLGGFNPHSGKFAATTEAAYWSTKGLPEDRAGRQMAHYFDVDAYQEQMRKYKEMKERGLIPPPKKPKKSKNKNKKPKKDNN
jgi:hypothetical protein